MDAQGGGAVWELAWVSGRGLWHGGMNSRDLCVVVGQGGIERGGAQIASIYRAEVVESDSQQTRRDLSAQFSADHVVDPLAQDINTAVAQIRSGGADLVVEASGNKTLIPTAISLVRP